MDSSELATIRFHSKLERALDKVRVILGQAKSPCWPADVHHEYRDKFFLAECLTNAASASQVNCLVHLGLAEEQFRQLCQWAAEGSVVSLRFRAEERCTFNRKVEREEEDSTKVVQEVSMAGAVQSALTSKVVRTVTEYFWDVEVSYELVAIRGFGDDSTHRIFLTKRSGKAELKTLTEAAPRPEARIPAALHECNVSWLLGQLEAESLAPTFKVKREDPKCHTPRRNKEVEDACRHFAEFNFWVSLVGDYLGALLRIQPDPSKKLDMNALSSQGIFIPVVPLFQGEKDQGESQPLAEGDSAATAPEQAATSSASAAEPRAGTGVLSSLAVAHSQTALAGVCLGSSDINLLLVEESRSLRQKRGELVAAFPDGSGDAMVTAEEATLFSTLAHCAEVCGQWAEAVDYIEGMLRKQLIAAIGKEVKPSDFAEYMQFHNRKLFAKAYSPTPFCFTVRRSELHSPEGTLSIEETASGMATPITTIASHSGAGTAAPMQLPLSASTDLSFAGDRHLHAVLLHSFSGQQPAQLSLVARARQFSSMLIVVGNITSATSLEPTFAAIVQNKDELSIPLELSTIPTPKEFKDAIESLSQEQQSFAKAFRSMQLASTLFGVLVIQIKPQLEQVLNLPEDSLTKEIKLTQDLMQLFIQYQIPSDLLSFDSTDQATGTEMVAASNSEKLQAVRSHVKNIFEIIDAAKKGEIEERHMQERYECPREGLEEEGARGWGGKGCSVGKGKQAKAKPKAAPPVMAMKAAPRRPAPTCGSAPPPPAPAPQAAAQSQQPPSQQQLAPSDGGPSSGSTAFRDYTQVPREMDQRFERLDVDAALRPTIIKPADTWTKRAQKALLAKPTTETLRKDEQKRERDAAFDLLDALTKSGGLAVSHASLHVVVAATHCFDKTVTETIIQDNVNPIDKVERSTLIMATTVHQQPAATLVCESQLPRVGTASPMLFLQEGSSDAAA